MSPEYDGRAVDWGKTSADYSTWRPNYPDRFFRVLKSLGVGIPGQCILDLGTGVGSMALQFADAGATVTALDISPRQIEEARRQAAARGLHADFIIASAESSGQFDASFDVITASQSWLYFDSKRMIPEVKRLLAPAGVLMTSHMYWLPRRDAIARASERLVLQYNPRWTHANVGGEVSIVPSWAEG